jgi:DDE superfamily endonuclease
VQWVIEMEKINLPIDGVRLIEEARRIFIFAGRQIDQTVINQLPADALVGTQENGYFIAAHFRQVVMHLDQHGSKKRPLLFIIDGAKGHIDLAAVEFAKSRQVDLLCMPSQATHLLQVADVAIFGPLKHYWKAACEELKRQRARESNFQERGIRRADIVPLVLQAWNLATKQENVQVGFGRTGISI